jgi:hypothetical protein
MIAERQVEYVQDATKVTTHSAFNKYLAQGCGPFYGERPHPLLWVLQRAADRKVTVTLRILCDFYITYIIYETGKAWDKYGRQQIQDFGWEATWRI